MKVGLSPCMYNKTLIFRGTSKSYTVQCPALRIQYMVNRGLRDILSIRTLLFHILHTLLLEQPKDALPVLHLESLCKTGAR